MLASGKLLIAEPFLGDPNFERSVILICQHDEQGSFGLTLNQTTNLYLKDVLKDEIYAHIPIYQGGPVEKNTLHFIHNLGNLVEDTIQIAEDLYWSGDFEQVKTLLNIGKITEEDIRFFVGYAGWSAGQLAGELTQNAWIVTDAEADFIFNTPAEQCWRAILKKMDGKYKAIANYPKDPRLN
ncbi:MAG: YqgE/AlgH family protein [Verrucomicrobia bacterium]|nr:YqgE/AlgH family protein [Cytophagales bacterium]